jgi:hypothetical protein
MWNLYLNKIIIHGCKMRACLGVENNGRGRGIGENDGDEDD